MGVDVTFKVRPHERMTREQFDDVQSAFYKEFPDPHPEDGHGHRWPSMEWDPYEDAPTIEIDSLDRYYGVGYERGPWEQIKAMGDWLAATFGETAEVRYGGDSNDDWDFLAPWSEERKKLDAHFAEVGHEPYERGFRRFQ